MRDDREVSLLCPESKHREEDREQRKSRRREKTSAGKGDDWSLSPVVVSHKVSDERRRGRKSGHRFLPSVCSVLLLHRAVCPLVLSACVWVTESQVRENDCSRREIGSRSERASRRGTKSDFVSVPRSSPSSGNERTLSASSPRDS